MGARESQRRGKGALLQAFVQLRIQSGMACDGLNQAATASSTYLTSGMERRDKAVTLHSTTDGTKAGIGLDRSAHVA